MTVLEQLGAFVAQAHAPSSLPGDVLRLHAVDSVGAWIAGLPTAEGTALLRWRRQASEGIAPGTMQRLRLDIATSCALARLSEIDDIHLASTTTPGAIVVPAAVAMAAAQIDCAPAVLAAALLAGYDVMVRFAQAIDGARILYRGIWPTYLAAPLGVATVAARILGLDAVQSAHALGLALMRSAPGVGYHNAATTARWFAVGQAAESGLVAALAARAGFTTDLGLLDGAFLNSVYGVTSDIAVLTDGLGTRFRIEEVAFKPWCAARQTMAATQGMLEFAADGVTGDTLMQVKAFVPPPHHRMVDHGVTAGDRASFLTSLPYQLAVAALAPHDILGQGLSEPTQVPDTVRALMQQIVIEPDDALLARFPSQWPARLDVTTPTGRHERFLIDVPGDPARPFDEAAVKNKFDRFAGTAVGHAAATRMQELALCLLTDKGAPARLVSDIGHIGGTPS